MGRNGGKRCKRTKRFNKPHMPDTLDDDQSYGVITKYLGGHTKRMNVTIKQGAGLREIVCSLKGSLRPRKCKQRADKGSYCIVEDTGAKEGVVVMILGGNDAGQIPEDIYDKLQRVGDEDADEDIRFRADQQDDPWGMPNYSDESDSDSDIAFEDQDTDNQLSKNLTEDDIDAI